MRKWACPFLDVKLDGCSNGWCASAAWQAFLKKFSLVGAWPEPGRGLVMAWSWLGHGLFRPGQEPGPRTLWSQGSRPIDFWDADFLKLRPGALREHPGTTKDQLRGSGGLPGAVLWQSIVYDETTSNKCKKSESGLFECFRRNSAHPQNSVRRNSAHLTHVLVRVLSKSPNHPKDLCFICAGFASRELFRGCILIN